MAQCYKTGALIYFPEYNAFARCDVFRIADCWVFRVNPMSWTAIGPRTEPLWGEVELGHSGHRFLGDTETWAIPNGQVRENN